MKYAGLALIFRNWKTIRIGFISFLITLLLSILILVMLGFLVGYYKHALSVIQQHIASTRKENDHLKQNELIVQKNLETWNQLHQIGLFQEEYRADWTNALDQFKHANPSFELSWQWRPQYTLETHEIPNSYQVLQLRASRMQLNAKLPHEEAFSSLFLLLQKQKGHVRPVTCKLARAPEINPRDMGILVSCEFDWLTIKLHHSID